MQSPDHEPGTTFSLTVIAAGNTQVKSIVILDGVTLASDETMIGDQLEVKGFWEGEKIVFEKKMLANGSLNRESRWIEGDRMLQRVERVEDGLWFEQVFQRV